MKNHSFPKNRRLRKRSEFLSLATDGKKIRNRFFIFISKTGRTENVRLGVTASKRVGNAVERNRIKRRIREFFRLNCHKIQGPLDINIIATKEATRLSSRQTNESLTELFDRLGKDRS